MRPPPTLFLHPPSLSISLSSSHPLSPFIHSSYSMPPKASTKKSQAKEVTLVAPKYVIFLWLFHCSHNARRVTRQTTAIRNQKAKRGKPASGKGGAPTRGRKQPKRCVLYFILYLLILISLLALKLFLTQRLRRTMKKRKMKTSKVSPISVPRGYSFWVSFSTIQTDSWRKHHRKAKTWTISIDVLPTMLVSIGGNRSWQTRILLV